MTLTLKQANTIIKYKNCYYMNRKSLLTAIIFCKECPFIKIKIKNNLIDCHKNLISFARKTVKIFNNLSKWKKL